MGMSFVAGMTCHPASDVRVDYNKRSDRHMSNKTTLTIAVVLLEMNFSKKILDL